MDSYIPKPISVSEYIDLFNSSIRGFNKRVIGEIVELTHASSGHVYFTLKDKHADALLRCVIWRSDYKVQGIPLKSGMEIIINGYPNIYPVRGSLSIVVTSLELVGEGQLKAAYEALKKSLTQQGLFAVEKKRPIPRFPQKIGIITSKEGAVIHDFTANVGRCGFRFTFCDSRVEGKEALVDLLEALQAMKSQDIEALVIMRGGGSMQSLAAFDNETLVREVANFPVPVIAAIGHHLDAPLVTLAADTHVSTPTAAANLLSTSWVDGRYALSSYAKDITRDFEQLLEDTELTIQLRKQSIAEAFDSIFAVFNKAEQTINEKFIQLETYLPVLSEKISHFGASICTDFQEQVRDARAQLTDTIDLASLERSIVSSQQNLSFLWQERITKPYAHTLRQTEKDLSQYEHTVSLRDPRSLLRQGYSLVYMNGKLVKSIEHVTIGDTVELTFHKGRATSEIKNIQKDHE